MENFLACHPNVFPMRDTYQIVINLTARGVCRLLVGDRYIDEENCGLYASETLVRKFSLPQKLLDAAGGYTVVFRRVIERKPYFSTMEEEERAVYRFYPITRTEGVSAVYIADVHCRYAQAEKVVAAAGEADLYIVNGDLGEIDSDKSLLDMNTFMGNISRGERPVLVGRGNHDTRGLLGERLPLHIATDRGLRTYFPFTVGPFTGVVLDSGEDKPDGSVVLGGYDCFEPWREREARELARMRLADRPYRIAVCHIPFMMKKAGDDFQRKTYTAMTRSLEKKNMDLLVSGHMHRFAYLPKGGSEESRYPHGFPVAVCSQLGKDGWGCARLTFYSDRTEIAYTLEGGNAPAPVIIKK